MPEDLKLTVFAVIQFETPMNIAFFTQFYVKLFICQWSPLSSFYYIPCVQTHPSGLCNSGDYSEEGGVPLDHGEVYVVKLELPQLDPCKSIYDKVKLLPVCHFSVIFISFSSGLVIARNMNYLDLNLISVFLN